MAQIGHQVLGVDTDEGLVDLLMRGRAPFFEPGLAEMLECAVRSGALRFTSSLAEAAAFGEVHFICVGTPQRDRSLAADVSAIDTIIDVLAPLLRRDSLVVGKSTVPVGTASRMATRLAGLTRPDVPGDLAWNPEFLREGSAVPDTLQPSRVVVGVTNSRAADILRSVYAPILAAGVPYIPTDPQTAELVKLASNAFLATKISFINAMADLCDAAGANVVTLAHAMGYDVRIGSGGLSAGLGFGGGCLPKDLRALVARGDELGVSESLQFLRDVDAINTRRRSQVVQIATELMGGTALGASVAVLGASYKPDTDDVRDSPALEVAAALAAEGARVRVTDPEAAASAFAAHPELELVSTVEDACGGADIVLHLTEWPQYRQIDPVALHAIVRQPVLLDARNALPSDRWLEAGWTVRGLGTGSAVPAKLLTVSPE
jgi:UDPglucose 6-dehydrogenase